MDRGPAMLAVVLDVYEGGKDLIPGWKLKEHAESALATRGIEGLRRYYEACLTCSGHRVKTTLERFMSIYLGAARDDPEQSDEERDPGGGVSEGGTQGWCLGGEERAAIPKRTPVIDSAWAARQVGERAAPLAA